MSAAAMGRLLRWPGSCGGIWRLDQFWAEQPAARHRKCDWRWDQVLQVLVSYRLIALGQRVRKLHRDWFGKSAMADLLGADFGLAEAHKLYACHDFLLQHKDALFSHLTARWRDLFNANFDVLLYDLASPGFARNLGIRRRGGRPAFCWCPVVR